MARLVPDGWQTMEAAGGMRRELDTLAMLSTGLSDGYTVYHAVHWTNIERTHAIHGEVDFVIVCRSGHLMLVEQKCGPLEETPEGLAKNYGGKLKSIPVQMARAVNSFRSKLAQAFPGEYITIEHLLYCPDHVCQSPHTAGVVAERIVDASRREDLCARIQEILPVGADNPRHARVDRFLCDIIQLETDASALVGQARALTTRVSSGLAYWARQIDMTPFRLRVTGTAGSGKTQLAIAEFRAAVSAGLRPLYVCFNRPLADHIEHIVPAGGMVCTFHTLCARLVRQSGALPPLQDARAFQDIVTACSALVVPPEMMFDTVIVDEGQDIQAEWRDLILRHTHDDGRVLWLEDPMQKLYREGGVELPGWTRLRADTNFRSPRAVMPLLQALVPPDTPLVAGSPVPGDELDVLVYSNAAELLDRVKEGVSRCLSAGFAISDVALLSYRGRDSSRVLAYDQLGPYTLKKFLGTYDAEGRPQHAEGVLVAETVHRFKGQSAPAVVLSEVDFASLGDEEARRLFVGATRAAMKLVLVLSEQAASQVLQRL